MCGHPVDHLPLKRSLSGSWRGIGFGLFVVGLIAYIISWQADVPVGVNVVAQSALPTPTPSVTFTPTPTLPPPTATAGPTDTPTITPTPTYRRHSVQSGENPSLIADYYGTTADDLIDLNPRADFDNLQIGDELIIPHTSVDNAVETLPTPVTIAYSIQEGDTLLDIAYRNGTSVNAIQEANPDANLNIIYPGQQIFVPQGTPTPTPSPTTAPTATFTPPPDYAAPNLLTPVDGQVVEADTLLFNWAATTLLGTDEFYRLELTWQDGTQTHYWTQSTAWRLDKAARPTNGRITWTVDIMRQTGHHDDGTRAGIRLNHTGNPRVVEWR